jgi:hypothetical protein
MLAPLRRHIVVGLIALGLVAAPGRAVAQQQAPQEFTFGLFGDLAYRPAQEPLLDNVLADLNRVPLAFVVHVGDLGSPRGAPTSFGPVAWRSSAPRRIR